MALAFELPRVAQMISRMTAMTIPLPSETRNQVALLTAGSLQLGQLSPSPRRKHRLDNADPFPLEQETPRAIRGTRWLLAAAALTFWALWCHPASADSTTQFGALTGYRVKAVLPAICGKIGGKLIYGGNNVQCQPPQVTSKTPTASKIVGRALPVSIRH
jgi:hypothetical protein